MSCPACIARLPAAGGAERRGADAGRFRCSAGTDRGEGIHGRTRQVQPAEKAVQDRRGSDRSLPVLPYRGGQTGDGDAALDLGLRQPIHRPAPGQEDHAQQLLHRRSFQRGVLQCLPCGLRLEGRPVRFQLGKERRLPGLPQHRPVRQDSRPGRPSRLPAHGISAGFRQVRRGGGPAKGRPAGRQDQPRHLRRVPFLRRRRRRGEARRSGFLAEAARPQAGRAHGRGWRQLHLRHLPQDRGPPHRRQPDNADRLRSAPCHPARRENRPQSGKLPGLPRRCAASAGTGRGPTGQPDAGRPPQRPYPHAGLPDLPHPRFRPRRRAHQDVLGLVHGGHAGRRRQAVPEEG